MGGRPSVKQVSTTAEVIRFGVFEADTRTGELRKHGLRIKLQEQPFQVLSLLLARPGELVTREELRLKLWPADTFVDFEQGLNKAINKLREALSDNREKPRYIETLPRRGYRFICPVDSSIREPALAKQGRPEATLLLLPANADAKSTIDASPREQTSGVSAAGFRHSPLRWSVALVISTLLLVGLFAYRPQQKRAGAPSEWLELTNFTDSATSPAISPDGRMLAFIRGAQTFVGPGQIYVKMLPGGEPVQLTHDSLRKMGPAFSPDGARIAYTVFPPFDTWVIPVLGGEPRLMLPNASGLTWIDGQHLLFSEVKIGVHMAVATASESRDEQRDVYVPPRDRGMAHRSYLSPDGKWVLLAEMDNGGWLPCRLVPFDGSSPGRQVGPQGASCTSGAWSPDGKWMYLSSDAGGQFHIWRQRPSDGDPEQVTFGPTEEEGIAMHPDGRSLVTSVGLEESSVWIHDPDGDRQVSSEGYAIAPYLSPGGTKVYYLVRPRGPTGSFYSGELWVADVKGGNPEHLLPGFAVTGYDISPDGGRIVFAAQDRQGESHLWIAALDHRFPPRQIPSSTKDDSPFFVPGGYVVYRGAEGGSNFVFRVNEDGTARQKVSPNPIFELISVSPDGEWFTALAPLQGEKDPVATWAYPVDGRAPLKICAGYCSNRWDRSGKLFGLTLTDRTHSDVPVQTVIFPLSAGKDLPPLPNFDIDSPIDPQRIPGVKVVDAAIAPGLTSSTYVYTRESVHRNLYSIPVP
jgi:Tol biopolymer transport system component/DNA-binding winged helix-turn-helix (wHTH) protein